jgi:DNA-binding GntR family transcriptional regulator
VDRVYGRLEGDGLVSSEQGRGTFVRAPGATADRGELDARRALRRQIARLEAELALRPPPPTETGEQRRAATAGGALLSAEQLEDVRDGLLTRLRELDDARAEVMRRLDELPVSEEPVPDRSPSRSSRSSASLSGARVRWVGA